MWWLFWAAAAFGLLVVVAYVVVMPFGAPYLPTLNKQSKTALELLGLKPQQVFVDLGCGDGRLLIAAAEVGVKAVGYELNPLLWLIAWVRTRRYGRQVVVRLGSFWRADLTGADGVFVFLVGHHMKRLDTFVGAQVKSRPLKLVSHAFKIPNKIPSKKVGAMYLYVYGPIAKGS